MRLSEPTLHEDQEPRGFQWRSLRILILPTIVAVALYALYAIGGYGNHEPPPKPLKHGAIYGTVIDEKQHPIPGASVSISITDAKGPTPGDIPLTDVKGHFYLPDMPSGTYILQATADGYMMQTQRTYVEPGVTAQIKLPLYKSPQQRRSP